MRESIARTFRCALLVLAAWSPLVLAQDVAVLGAPNTDSWNDDVVAKVAAAGTFSSVTGILASNVTPTLNELLNYDAVLVYSDSGGFLDRVALGDVLADYVDLGGTVVVAVFAFNSSSLGIQGRLLTGGYLPFNQNAQSGGSNLTLVPVIANHPLLAGVGSFDGGSSSFHTNTTVANGATLVAEWSNGQPLVAQLAVGGGTVIGLNFYPPSSDARGDFWVASTDGGQLMANALGSRGFPGGPSIPVPTMSPVGLLILALLFMLIGGVAYRRLA